MCDHDQENDETIVVKYDYTEDKDFILKKRAYDKAIDDSKDVLMKKVDELKEEYDAMQVSIRTPFWEGLFNDLKAKGLVPEDAVYDEHTLEIKQDTGYLVVSKKPSISKEELAAVLQKIAKAVKKEVGKDVEVKVSKAD